MWQLSKNKLIDDRKNNDFKTDDSNNRYKDNGLIVTKQSSEESFGHII